ncbi:Neuropathy target esterase [Lamellibrachia satsuma]|nr:Neuropathy target esterase [Lamellibrachia satsuma]
MNLFDSSTNVDDITESLKQLKEKIPEQLSTLEWTMNLVLSVVVGGLTFVLVFYYVWFKKAKCQVLQSVTSGLSKPRFRKRDKMLFYGRKMLRRVRSFARISMTNGRRTTSKKRQLVMKLARKLLRFKKDREPQLRTHEPPPSFLEADWPECFQGDQRLPAEVCYLLRSVRVLGHFEKPIFLELCRFMESRIIPAGTPLFCIGDQDDSIFVVQTGCVNVYVADHEGKDHLVKEVNKGECIHSLLSLHNVLTGRKSCYKTVSAVAASDATVIRLPMQAFQIVLQRFPESLVRMIQIIMVRLQRVTFMALYNYLGLSHELMNPENLSDPTMLVNSIDMSPKGTPVKQSHDMRPSSLPDTGTVSHSVGDDDDIAPTGGSRGSCESQEGRKRSSSLRRPSELTARMKPGPIGDSAGGPSDFDVVCSQARVTGIDDDTLPTSPMSSSPSKRAASEPVSVPPPNTKRGNKKAVLSDQVTFISCPSEPGMAGPTRRQHYLDDEELVELASKDIAKMFGLKDENLLFGKLYMRHLRAGMTLMKQGDQNTGLYFIVTGQLVVLQHTIGTDCTQRTLFLAYPGNLVGALAVLTGEPSFFTIRAYTDARLVYISKQDYYCIMKSDPIIVLHVSHTVVQRMSSFVRQTDFALDWMQIEAGRALFRQGERADCIYIILNGRLRSVVTLEGGKKEMVGEYGRGELVGLVEVITQTERATTMMAVRDTELAQIPDGLLNLIKRLHPQVVTRLIRLLGHKILGSLKNRPNPPAIYSALSEHPNQEPRPAVANLNTVALLPINDVPLSNFTFELQHALSGIDSTLILTSEVIQDKLGTSALDMMNEYRLSSWLCQQEDIHRMVLYQCDNRLTPWTQRCIRQADCLLVVALADTKPTVGQLEKQVENVAMRAQKELVLLHQEGGPLPNNTIEWLNLRGWCSSHHHIRCPHRMFRKRATGKTAKTYRKLSETSVDRLSDFSRLARFLTGTSVGLVLGGGGARGLSHVGLIRAMCEAGIPIDMVCGTSIGSLIGALWAEERNLTTFTQRGREWAMGMSSLWKKLLDLTYPVTSMFSGSEFNRSIQMVFKDRQIEDLLIPYFCITTDITSSKMRVHTSGSVWRYVRASMSLSGYLPPLCDPIDGHLLLDGGYVNNLPADVMKAMGAQTIFAADVGSQDEMDLTNYGDHLSGWWLLWKKWNPWTSSVRVPNMAEIQSRLAYVSCVQQLDQVKNSGYVEYVRPPIDKYRTLQFAAFDDIHDAGYHHAKALFESWSSKGLVNQIFKEKSHVDIAPPSQKPVVPIADFTDLAELISRIQEPDEELPVKFHGLLNESDDEEEEEERLSVISEPPILADMGTPNMKRRDRPYSEGASPCTTPSDEESHMPQLSKGEQLTVPTEAKKDI